MSLGIPTGIDIFWKFRVLLDRLKFTVQWYICQFTYGNIWCIFDAQNNIFDSFEIVNWFYIIFV